MISKKLYIFAAIFAGIHIAEQPLHAKFFNSDPIAQGSLNQNVYYLAGAYVAYNFLTRQDMFVENQAPYAYQWYQAMVEKYPQAHFDQKHFLQKPAFDYFFFTIQDWASKAAWISSSQHIYFESTDIKIINILYKKVIDGYPLDEKEKTMLAHYEFILLHEAGHIEHRDAQKSAAIITGLFAGFKGIEYISQKTAIPSENEAENKICVIGYEVPEYLVNIKLPISVFGCDTVKNPFLPLSNMLSSAQGAACVAAIFSFIRHHESKADEFACTLADTTTLKEALKLFENDGTDRLYNLENKTLKPYVTTDTPGEKIIQTLITPLEYTFGYIYQQVGLLIKSTNLTRWIHDTHYNPMQPSPNARAAMIRNELAARQQK